MKIVIIALALSLGGCGIARDSAVLLYCAANQHDINRRCN